MPMQDRIKKDNEICLVYTYYYVREDIAALYGFPSQEEYDMFVLLLQVSGIGPKVAITMVAQIPPSEFALAVITGDISRLTQIKGVGKKGAERIILELKDKLKGFTLSEFGFAGDDTEYISDSQSETGSVMNEAISALVVLGYSPTDASKAVRNSYVEGMNTEKLVRQALRSIV
jgi:Holliday junction DNA helicase RuvA